MEHIEAEHPRPRHFLLHLSDPHLLGGPEPLYGTVDSEARLIQLFDEVKASGARPEAVIFTGDLADKGDAQAYVKLRAIVEPACKELGAQVIWAMGNHDDRANFRKGLLDQPGTDEPVDHSYFINGLRVITLDTTVPGIHHGELSGAQLDWLARQLDPETWVLAETLDGSGKQYTKAEVLTRIHHIFEAFLGFEGGAAEITSIVFEEHPEDPDLQGTGYAEGVIRYDAQLESRETQEVNENFRFDVVLREGYWVINGIRMPGLQL